MKFGPCGPRTFSNSRCSGKGFADLNREPRGRDQGRQRRPTAIKSLKNWLSLYPQGRLGARECRPLPCSGQRVTVHSRPRRGLGLAHRKGKPGYAHACDPKLVAIIGGTAVLEKTRTDGVI